MEFQVNKDNIKLVEFAQYMEYCKELEFDEQPDYEYLLNLFNALFITMTKGKHIMELDWSMLKHVNLI